MKAWLPTSSAPPRDGTFSAPSIVASKYRTGSSDTKRPSGVFESASIVARENFDPAKAA
jgi:hypothetical protein